MNEMISIGDLILFLLFLLGAVAIIFLIVVLNNVNKVVKQVGQVLADNKTHIDKTMQVMPEAANNLNSAAVSIKETVDRAGHMMGNLEGTVSEAAATMEDTTENLIDIIRAVVSAAKAVMTLFSKE